MHGEETPEEETPPVAEPMPHGPDDYKEQKEIPGRSKREKGEGFSQRGLMIFGAAAIIIIAIVFWSLLENQKRKNGGTIPNVPVPMTTKGAIKGDSLDSVLPHSPGRGLDSSIPNVSNSPGVTGSSIANGTADDALSKTLVAASASTAPIPTFAPATPLPGAAGSSSVNNGSGVNSTGTQQYAEVPPPVQQAPVVPNPGSAGQTPLPYRGSQGSISTGQKSLFIGGDNAGGSGGGGNGSTNGSATATTPDRTAGSDPVSNGSVYEPTPGPIGGTETKGTDGKKDVTASNIDFANGKSEKPYYLTQVRQNPIGKTEIWAGSILPAQLDAGINTNLPGLATAHITQDVYDSRTGTFLLIPKGTKIVGNYNSIVDAGQNRVQIKFEHLIWPDGKFFSLEGMGGADRTGDAGVYADVNNHRGPILTASIIGAVVAAAAQSASGGGGTSYSTNSSGQLVSTGIGQEIAKQAGDYTKGLENVPPELTVPHGANFTIIVDRTMVLQPWSYGS